MLLGDQHVLVLDREERVVGGADVRRRGLRVDPVARRGVEDDSLPAVLAARRDVGIARLQLRGAHDVVGRAVGVVDDALRRRRRASRRSGRTTSVRCRAGGSCRCSCPSPRDRSRATARPEAGSSRSSPARARDCRPSTAVVGPNNSLPRLVMRVVGAVVRVARDTSGSSRRPRHRATPVARSRRSRGRGSCRPCGAAPGRRRSRRC